MAEIVITFSLFVLALLLPAPKGFRLLRPSAIVSFFIFFSTATAAIVYGLNFTHPQVIVFYILSDLMFLCGDAAAVLANGERNGEVRRFAIQGRLSYGPVFVLMLLAAILGFILTLYLFVSSGLLKTPSLALLATTLRYEHLHGDNPTYGAFQLLVAAQAIGSILILNDARRIRRLGYLLYLFFFVSCIVKLERTGILQLTLSTMFLLYVRNRRIRIFVIPSAVVLSLFVALAFATGKTANKDAGFFLYSYMSYGIHSFDQHTYHKADTTAGKKVLGPVAKLVTGDTKKEDAGLAAEIFNVFTFMEAPYTDFGIAGLVVCCFVFGFVWGMVFNGIGRSPFCLLMYSWMIYPCVMVFYAWQFSLTTYIYLLVCYALLLPGRAEAAAGSASLAAAERGAA